ncbi:ankyrin repeat-containing domain protein [Cokeromyces recurvatus]|uniref:ankyrin repeat-containing domain protein n=1 Tax=Cokeromyces recurvatus TaxID=90255 RepID=UPI00221E8DAF|nr:ankyrin repeat-containing domain protein [Cokeromyces recurvatus]KAI7898387.1 ankyrin repeat-containing domain protein [Cokeromyces recurvatus]
MPSLLARTIALLNNNAKSTSNNSFSFENESRISLGEEIDIDTLSNMNIIEHYQMKRPQYGMPPIKQERQLMQFPTKLSLQKNDNQERQSQLVNKTPSKPKLTQNKKTLSKQLQPITTLPSHLQPFTHQTASHTTTTTTTTIHTPPLTPYPTIWKAAEQGDIKALQHHIHTTKLDTAILLNLRDPETDCTLLHLAISSPHYSHNPQLLLQVLQLLLQHGADVTLSNIYNVQPIHMMAHHHRNTAYDLITLALDNGANPNARDGDGWTPLHYITRFCGPADRQRLIDLLLSRGADLNLTDSHHKTPLFGLLANDDDVISLSVLIQRGTDLCQRGEFLDPVQRITRRGTVLLQAARYGRFGCLQFLICSSISVLQLRRAVSRDELTYALALVNERAARDPNEGKKFEKMLILLQGLEDRFMKDPLSFLNCQRPHLQKKKKKEPITTTVSSSMSVNGRSLKSMLGSIHRRKPEEGVLVDSKPSAKQKIPPQNKTFIYIYNIGCFIIIIVK